MEGCKAFNDYALSSPGALPWHGRETCVPLWPLVLWQWELMLLRLGGSAHTNWSSLFVVLNYKSIGDACPFCCIVNLQSNHPTPGNLGYWTCLLSHTLTDCSSTLVVIMDPKLHPWSLPHTFQIYDWKVVEDTCTTCMKLDSLRWLDAWAWPDFNGSWTCGRCSGVMWPMNCFGRSRCHLIYTTQEIRDHRTGQPINQ